MALEYKDNSKKVVTCIRCRSKNQKLKSVCFMEVEEIKGSFDEDYTNINIGIVVSRWNSVITDRLFEGAKQTLEQQGIEEDQVIAAFCPGSYEIPLTAQKLLQKEDIDGVITLGVVIRGDTPHFEYVCSAVNDAVAALNREYGKPVTFGVLTTDTVQQALERAGMKSGNKGGEAALALLEMISVIGQIDNQ